MKKHLLLPLAAIIAVMNLFSQSTAFQLSNTNSSQSVFEDANGLVGIGTATPLSLLHIHHADVYSNNSSNYFSITQDWQTGVPPNVTMGTATKFIVTSEGKVGIGNGEPNGMLHVQTSEWADLQNDFLGKPIAVFSDPNENILGAFINEGTSPNDDPAGGFIVLGNNAENNVAIGVLNPLTEMIPFAVLGNSTIAMGADVSENSNFTPTAQVTIARTSIYDYILKLQNTDQSADFFTVHNNGNVGIGVANSGSATLLIKGEVTTTLDLLHSTNPTTIRFMGGTSNARHIIADDANGDLLIDPGMANGGANDKLIVDGNTYLTKQLGVGLDVQTNSTLALKGTTGTNLDLLSTASSGWDNQIRFKNSSGTTRHVITDDLSSNNLVIHCGSGGGAIAKLKIEGDEYVTGGITADGSSQINNDLRVTGKVIIGDPLLTTSAYVNDAKLSVDGLVICNHAVVKLSEWQDKVFEPNYELQGLNEVEEFVKRKKHLPEIPSEKEVLENGISLGEMNALLLKKIEELTLYVINLHKRISEIEKTNR